MRMASVAARVPSLHKYWACTLGSLRHKRAAHAYTVQKESRRQSVVVMVIAKVQNNLETGTSPQKEIVPLTDPASGSIVNWLIKEL